MKVLVVGLGQVGGALALSLKEDGYEVRGIKRRPSSSTFPTVFADITQRLSLSSITEPVQAVVYVMTPTERSEAGYRKVYLDGLHNLSQRLADLDCFPKWFFVSSTSVYGQSQGEWVDESSLAKPNAYNGRVLLEAENWVTSKQGTVLRFAGIYGPTRFRLIKNLLAGKAVQQTPPYYTNRIHEQDCVGMLKLLIDKFRLGQVLEPIYLGCDDDPAPAWTVNAWLAEQLDVGPSVLQAKESCENPEQNKRCRNDKIKKLGYELYYPSFREGYQETIQTWQASQNRL